MLREIAVEEERPGNLQTTFRLRVDGNVTAENVTELETQFLVSENARTNSIVEGRCKATPSSSSKGIAPPCRWEAAGGLSANEGSNGAVFMPSLRRACVSAQAERRGASR